ncbi:MAG: hypothetical protein LBL90_10545 [Prevotellaceae bacterium]|jgi:hypothetical protein|nr:hypothetical protein [Prevotellaceae bacterium]
MKKLFIVLLCTLPLIFSSCSSDNNGDDPTKQNSFSVNGLVYPAHHMGYIGHSKGIALYFGNDTYGKTSKYIEISINTNKVEEGVFYYQNNNSKNIIHAPQAQPTGI